MAEDQKQDVMMCTMVRACYDKPEKDSNIGGSYTWTYILGCPKTKECLIIDPVLDRVDRDLKVIDRMGLNLKYIIDTHIHGDHFSGARKIQKFREAKSIMGCQHDQNKSKYRADLFVKDGDIIRCGQTIQLKVIHTPGHTEDAMCFLLNDESMVFTGDTLLIDKSSRCDVHGGSCDKLYNSVTKKLFTLRDNCIVYPGHDYNGLTSSTIGEEKRYNFYFGGEKSREDYIKLMDELHAKLSKEMIHKKMDEYVNANFTGGELGSVSKEERSKEERSKEERSKEERLKEKR